MNTLGLKVLAVSLGALFLLGGCYVLVAHELGAWNAASTFVIRDFRRALADGEFHAALTRAVGETASFVLTGNIEYRDEAAEALEQAQRAERLLQQTADDDLAAPGDRIHAPFLARQSRLLQVTQQKIQSISATMSSGGVARSPEMLAWIYEGEAETDALWQEIVAHHQMEREENELSLADHSRRAQWLLIAGIGAFAIGVAMLVTYVRLRIVKPLTVLAQLTAPVAAGDLTRRADVTHDDEIGLLQRSFNRMLMDLERQQRERSTLVQTLARSRDAAESASRAKSVFLAKVSHEIRTPMNGVLMSLDLMHETARDAEQRELADVARTSARSLLVMLNDLLDFSRIEAGRLELQAVNFEPRRLFTQMVELQGRRAQAKGLAMRCRVADDVPDTLCGDPTRLGQVLLNLLDNAIKFTERGSIDVAVSAEVPVDVAALPTDAAAPRPVLLRVRVSDSGVGIPAEAAPMVFEPFYQAETSTHRSGGGIGLGLGIARQLTRMMGGELGFDSEVGKGSSFWFTARLRSASQPQAAPASTMPPGLSLPAGKAVLLAEDHRDTRDVVARMLQRRGLSVSAAENGRAALALASAGRFDLILMDCQMPEMDGLEAMRAIRALGDARSRVPIVAITAYGLTESKQHYLDLGFDDLVVKPCTVEEIEQVLVRWLTAQG
jgi:signal transduction histidine kinase